MLNFFIGGLFILFMIQIYRSMHGKGNGGVKGSGKESGSGFGSKGGGGGLGDIFSMGKSNV
jgi:hypothetical protein